MKTIDKHEFCEKVGRDVAEMSTRAHEMAGTLERVRGDGEHGLDISALFDFVNDVERSFNTLSEACSLGSSAQSAASGGYGKSGDALNWWFG